MNCSLHGWLCVHGNGLSCGWLCMAGCTWRSAVVLDLLRVSVEVLMRLFELAEPNLVFPAAAEDVKSHRNSSFQGSQQFSKGFFVVVVGASQPGCVVDNRRWRVALGGWARGLGPQIFTQCFCVAGEFLHHVQIFLV